MSADDEAAADEVEEDAEAAEDVSETLTDNPATVEVFRRPLFSSFSVIFSFLKLSF